MLGIFPVVMAVAVFATACGGSGGSQAEETRTESQVRTATEDTAVQQTEAAAESVSSPPTADGQVQSPSPSSTEGWILWEGELLTVAYPPGWDIEFDTPEEEAALAEAGILEGADSEVVEAILATDPGDLSQQPRFYLNDDFLGDTSIAVSECVRGLTQRGLERTLIRLYEGLGSPLSPTGETVEVDGQPYDILEMVRVFDDPSSGVPIEVAQLWVLPFLPEQRCGIAIILTYRPDSPVAADSRAAFLQFLGTVSFRGTE